MRTMRIFRAGVVAAALATLACVALWCLARAKLPERIPAHFDLAGRPDRFGDRDGTIALMVAFSVAISALLIGLAFFVRRAIVRWPAIVNLPRKERILALPPEERVAAVEPLAAALAWIAVPAQALFVYILLGTYRVATGEAATLPAWPIAICVLAVLAIAGVGVRRSIRAVG
jgi:hypothetical protein